MPDTAQLVAMVIALLTGGLLRDVFAWLTGLIRGRGDRRSELEKAHDRADNEATNRRIVEEHASHLRRILYAADCVAASDIPPFPPYRKKATE